MNIIYKYLFGGLAIAGVIIYILYLHGQLERQTIKAEDYKEQLTDQKQVRIVDDQGRQHLQTSAVEISNSKNLAQNKTVQELIKEVASLKRLVSVSSTGINSVTTIYTLLKDSVTIHKDTIKCLKWSDGYTELNGCFSDSIPLVSTYRDSVDCVVFKGKRVKKFLFIRYGPRELTTDVKCRNPNAKISSNLTVIVKE
jgi:hypothetical protein